MSKFYYVRLVEPQKYRMGYDGVLPDATPFYADCADCGAEEPVIYGGIMGDDQHLAVLEQSQGTCKLAVFCEACTDKRMYEPVLQELELLEEQIACKSAGLDISRLLDMENVAFLEGQLKELQQRHYELAQELASCP